MVVWVICLWLYSILVSFYLLVLTLRWLCESFGNDYIKYWFLFMVIHFYHPWYLALGLYLAGKCRHPGHSFHLWHHDVLNATTLTLYQWGCLTACSTFDEVTKYSCLPMVPPGLLLLGLVMELLPLYFHPALGALLYYLWCYFIFTQAWSLSCPRLVFGIWHQDLLNATTLTLYLHDVSNVNV